MSRFRRQLVDCRFAAMLLVALALVMKVVVPAGFMPEVSPGGISIVLCTGYGPQTVTMAMPGMDHGSSHEKGDGGKTEQPCAFSGVHASTLASVDPLVLALAIAFILSTAIAPMRPLVAAPRFLRPPLRGPPARH